MTTHNYTLTLANLIPATHVFKSCSDSAQKTFPSLDVMDGVAGIDAYHNQ